MFEDPTTPPAAPVGIADVNMPVDGGLSGLGLLMSLTGAIFLAMALSAATLMLLTMMLAGGNMRGIGTALLIALVVITVTVLRSWAHRAAGERLLYEGPGTPRSAMTRYILLAGVQTAVVAVALGSQHVPGRILGPLVVILMGWPVALAIVCNHARFKALLDQPVIPQGEDKGFEGASILMVVFGLTGLLFGAVLAVSMLDQLGPVLKFAPFMGLSMIAIVTLLIARSSLHVRAGVRGMLDVHRELAADAVVKYGNFAVLAGGFVCGIIFLVTLVASQGRMAGTTVLLGLVTAGFLMWGLAIWPLLIKRFFVERQFADLLVSGEITHARAPDRGLTTLGWFLFGQAVLGITLALPALISPMAHHARDPMSQMFAAFQTGGTASWWSIGVAVLQLVAAWQLIRMRPDHQRLVTLWGAVAALVAVYVNYPMLKAMAKGGLGGLFGDSRAMLANLSFMAVAISLVAPIAALILVNRKQRDLPAAVLKR